MIHLNGSFLGIECGNPILSVNEPFATEARRQSYNQRPPE
jgi:hypothetical protein